MKRLLMTVSMVLALAATGASSMWRSAQSEHSSSPPGSLNQAEKQFRVAGRAINAAGEAVAGAEVFVELDGAVAARVPTGVSNDEGYFSIELSELGNYTVYGSKEEAGYPLTVSGFHKQVRLDQIPKLHITEHKNVENVILQLGQPAATIEGTVRDALSDRELRTASITLRRADNPDLLYRTSTLFASPGKFKIVVPTEPFTITVEASGYQTWNYSDDRTGVRMSSIKLRRGEVRKLQVGLRKQETR